MLVFRRVQASGASTEFDDSPGAQFHRHAPQCTHFSRSKAGTASVPRVMACPEHMAMQVLAAHSRQSWGLVKLHVIGESGGGLHLAAHQQRVLMRDQKAAIVLDCRPAAGGHQLIVKRYGLFAGVPLNCRNLLRREPTGVEGRPAIRSGGAPLWVCCERQVCRW